MPPMHAVSRLPPHAAAAAVAVFGGRGARHCSNATQSSVGGRRDFNLNSCPDEFEGAGLIAADWTVPQLRCGHGPRCKR
jgi:hypothetical protein